MNKIGILTKNYLNVFLGSIKWRKRKDSVVAGSSMVLVGAVAILAMIFFQVYAIYATGESEFGLLNGAVLILMLAVLSTITRSLTPTKSTDTDLLLSMPIKKSEIVISYSFSKYIFELVPVLIIFAPYVILYLIMIKFSVISLLGSLIVIFFLPLLAIGLSYILSTIINLIGGKFRSANIIKILITLLLIIAIIFLSSFSGTNTKMMEVIYPAVWMKNIILSFDLLSLLYFLLLTIIPFVVGVYLFSKSFGIPKAKYVSNNKELKFKKRHPLFSLMSKEAKRYLSSPIYVINTIIGPLFISGLTIFTLFAGDTIDQIFKSIPEPYLLYKPYLVMVVFIWMIGMTAVSASSISLEGKSIWILKVHPLSPKTIFLAKAGFNFLLVAPISILAVIVLKFTINLSVLDAVIIMMIILAVSVFTSLSGVMINLWFPKMEWNNDVAVVKQSMSVFLSLLPAMFFPMLIIIPVFFIDPAFSFALYGLLVCIVYTLLIIILWKLLMKSGVKSFYQL